MVRTRIIEVDPVNPEEIALAEAAELIKHGGLVAFPTETVYGLGADAYNRDAVKRVFEAKNRPMDNPLIIHICKLEWLNVVARNVPAEARRIAERLWPGPVTLVLWKSEEIPVEVTAGLPKVAVRLPSHPVAAGLIERSGVPIAAPSANLAGRPSPTTAQHVIQDLYGRVDVILDGGETLFGVESTIIDLTSEPPRLLRPGPIPVEDLERVLGTRISIPDHARGLSEAEIVESPGMKYRHYAPDTALKLVEALDYHDPTSYSVKVLEIAEEYRSRGFKVVILASRETCWRYVESGFEVIEIGSRKNFYEIARNLFNSLRRVDELKADLVIAEGFEEKGLGLTIMNRLRKAARQDRILV